MIRAVVVAALLAVGCFFLTVGTVGLLRFPNVYNRMHATSKPTTLGTAAIFLAGFVTFGPGNEGLTALVGIVFLLVTVPSGAHMIARAAQRTGVEFEGSVTWPDASRLERSDDGDADGSDATEREDGADATERDDSDADERDEADEDQ